MSADEDTELRDLVAQTLEKNGVLSKIRAELRASVFLALEENDGLKKCPLNNQELKRFTNTNDGKVVLSLFKEFLQFYSLDYTLAVLEPEANITSADVKSRENLCREFNVQETGKELQLPLIAVLLNQLRGPSKTSNHSNSESDHVNIPKDLSAAQIEDARKKFDHYDKDSNGFIDKDELRQLFLVLFPHFHRNMLDRYVNDELRATDKDFNSKIDFDEFLGLYKRLFVFCRSVVSHEASEMVGLQRSNSLSPQSSRRHASQLSPSKHDNTTPKSADHPDPHTSSPLTGSGAVLSPPKPESSRQDSIPEDLSFASDNDDAFFDDPLPSGGAKTFSISNKNSPEKSSASERDAAKLPANHGLDNGPIGDHDEMDGPIGNVFITNNDPPGSALDDTDGLNIDSIKGHDLDYETSSQANDDYEDDFLHSSHSNIQGPASPAKSVGSHLDDITTEDIDEDLSIGSDFLPSSKSDKFDDLTTDRTISMTSQNGVDYTEDVLQS